MTHLPPSFAWARRRLIRALHWLQSSLRQALAPPGPMPVPIPIRIDEDERRLAVGRRPRRG